MLIGRGGAPHVPNRPPAAGAWPPTYTTTTTTPDRLASSQVKYMRTERGRQELLRLLRWVWPLRPGQGYGGCGRPLLAPSCDDSTTCCRSALHRSLAEGDAPCYIALQPAGAHCSGALQARVHVQTPPPPPPPRPAIISLCDIPTHPDCVGHCRPPPLLPGLQAVQALCGRAEGQVPAVRVRALWLPRCHRLPLLVCGCVRYGLCGGHTLPHAPQLVFSDVVHFFPLVSTNVVANAWKTTSCAYGRFLCRACRPSSRAGT